MDMSLCESAKKGFILFFLILFLSVPTFLHAGGFFSFFKDPLFASPSYLNVTDNALFFFKKNPCLKPEPPSHLLFLNQEVSLLNSVKKEEELTLKEVIHLALTHHPQLQILREEINVQVAQLGQARSLYLPYLTIGGSYASQKTVYPEAFFDVNTDYNKLTYYASLTWKLFDFGIRNAQNRRANALLESAIYTHDAKIQSILLGIIELYFDAQTKKATAQARKENVMLAKQILTIVQKRESVGVADVSAILQSKTALAKSELDYTRAKGQYDKSLLMLKFALGLENQVIVLSSEPEFTTGLDLSQNLSEFLAFAKSHHPFLRAAKAKLKAEKEQRSVVLSEGFPVLELTHGEYNNGRPNQGLSSMQSQESMSSVSLSVPVFEGFSRVYKLKESDAQIRIKEAEVRETELKILEELTLLHRDALTAFENLEFARRLLETARFSLENVRNQYEKGVADSVDVLNVQAAFFDANLEHSRTLSEWQSSFLRFLSYSGVRVKLN